MNDQLLSFSTGRYIILLALLNCLTFSQVYANIHQGNVQPLSEILDEMGQHYQVFFSYDATRLKDRKVDFSWDLDEGLDRAIERLMSSANLQYDCFNDRYFVIYEESKQGRKDSRRVLKKFKQIEKLRSKGNLSIDHKKQSPGRQLSSVANAIMELRIEKTISGVVKDQEGAPLIGATILLKGSTTGTTSDLDGNFTLSVPDDAQTIVVSYTGFNTQEIDISGQTTINIVLEESISSLDQVVVIGYGTAKVRDLSGSVESVDMAGFDEQPNVSLMEGITGAVPGLSIGQVDQAGENPSIGIRGQSSLSGVQDPLIVMDGVIYRGDLISINPDDIQSIEVLKDASATAIYGSQASNGVILLTTKNGSDRKGKPTIQFSSTLSLQQPWRELRAQGPEAFIKKVEESDIQQSRTEASGYLERNPDWVQTTNFKTSHEIRQFEAGRSFNWYDQVTNSSPVTQVYNLSVQNGNETSNYFASFGYTEQEGHLKDEFFDRINGRINLGTKVTDWFSIDLQSFIAVSNYGPQTYSPGDRFIEPYATAHEEDGTLVQRPTGNEVNPIIEAAADVEDKRLNLNGIITGKVLLPVKGLDYQVRYGNNFNFNRENRFLSHGSNFQGFGVKGSSIENAWTLDNILSYSRSFNEIHQLDVTLLYGLEKRELSFTRAEGSNFIKDVLGFDNLQVADAAQQQVFSGGWKEASLYNMARASYRLLNRYLFTGTVRRDGFSGFSADNKFGVFPSLAVGWVLSEEPFIKSVLPESIDWLKLRASYGTTGNRTIGRYQILAEVAGQPGYVTADGTSLFTQWISALESPELRWEKTTGINIGLDLRLHNGRYSASVDYYNKNTSDLLYEVDIPAINRFTIFPDNLGEIHNEGLEINLSSVNIQSPNFKWTTDLNLSRNRNRINTLLGFDVDGDGVEDDLTSEGLFIGQSLGSIFDYSIDGFWQLGDEIPSGYEFGSYKVLDINGDGVWDGNDRSIIGDRDPSYRLGINNVLTYKNWTLRVFINSVQGGKNRYLAADNLYGLAIFNNESHFNIAFPENLNYWTPENPTGAMYQRPGIKGSSGIAGTRYSSRSFIRLRNLSLSYALGADALKFAEGLRLTVSARNLLTITDWEGWDPETGVGIDDGGRPVMQSFSFGLNISL